MSSSFFKRNRQHFDETYTDILEILYLSPKKVLSLQRNFQQIYSFLRNSERQNDEIEKIELIIDTLNCHWQSSLVGVWILFGTNESFCIFMSLDNKGNALNFCITYVIEIIIIGK